MQTIYGYKKMKNGLYRLYKSEPQAVTAWRGTNDKITVVRDDNGKIVTFSFLNTLQEYCKTRFNQSAYDMSDW